MFEETKIEFKKLWEIIENYFKGVVNMCYIWRGNEAKMKHPKIKAYFE